MKKISFFCLAFILSFATTIMPNTSSVKAEEISVNETVKLTENFVKQAENVNDNVIELDKDTKRKLILKLDEILSKSSDYNVGITSKFSASDFEIIAHKLPDGNIQYSLSKTNIETNKKMVVNKYELLNFVFDENLNFKDTYEVKGELTGKNIVNSKLWINGKLGNEISYDINNVLNDSKASVVGNEIAEEKINDEDKKDSKEFTGSGIQKRWNCTQSCVASKGVNLLVLGIMGGLCVSVCNPAALAASAGLAGGACYACVNATGIGGISTVLNCWKKCSY